MIQLTSVRLYRCGYTTHGIAENTPFTSPTQTHLAYLALADHLPSQLSNCYLPTPAGPEAGADTNEITNKMFFVIDRAQLHFMDF